METKQQIQSIEDIKTLVNAFYAKVRKDDLLKDIFNEVIQDNWDSHLEKMYRFWQTVLLDEHTYHGSPFYPHAKLPITDVHFTRWTKLFQETIDELFVGELAEKAKLQAERMALMFQHKHQHIQQSK